jgi:FMN phosphatase YigB (HAD superfamily)
MHNGHQPPDAIRENDTPETPAAPRPRDGKLDVVWDIDGTLLEHAHDVDDYTDVDQLARACRANEALIDIATGWTGHCHYILTGREAAVDDFTIGQLVQAGVVDEDGRSIWRAMHMQPEWDGYEAMIAFKADALANLYYDEHADENASADLYVADHEADEEAANRAGVRYLHPDELVAMSPAERAGLLRELGG